MWSAARRAFVSKGRISGRRNVSATRQPGQACLQAFTGRAAIFGSQNVCRNDRQNNRYPELRLKRHGEPALTSRCLIIPLLVAMFIATAHRDALAQSAPAAQPPAPAGQGNATPSAEECKNEFAPLREEAERRGKLIKDASTRHAPVDETCRLIRSFVEAEIRMIDFVEARATACAVPASTLEQLKSSNRTTEALQTKICNVTQQPQK
jgi:hypothetical protein